MDHVVGAELAFAAAGAGYPVLRFNYRGVGASQGQRGDTLSLIEDALAALEVAVDNAVTWLTASPPSFASRVGGPVVLAAINGSDQVALEVRRRAPEQIAGLLLVSPLTSTPAEWPEDAWVVVGADDIAQSSGTLGAAGRRIERIEGADRTFVRGLPKVGKAAVGCLTEAAISRKH
jgi:alpha/beta superfamily hydrolase